MTGVALVGTMLWTIQTAGYLDLHVNHRGVITQVDPDNAAGRAGVRPGNILVAVSVNDALTIADAPFDLALNSMRAGDKVQLSVEDSINGQRRDIRLIASHLPVSQWPVRLWILLMGLAYLVIGVRVVTSQLIGSAAGRRLSLLVLLSSLRAVAVDLSAAGVNLQFISLALAAAVSACQVQLHSVLPQRPRSRMAQLISQLHLLLGVVLTCLGVVLALSRALQLLQAYQLVILLFDLVSAAVVASLLIAAYRAPVSNRTRVCVRFLVWTLAITYLLRLMAFMALLSAPDDALTFWLGRLALLSQILIPIAYLFVIRLKDVYTIDLLVNRSSTRILAFVGLFVIHWLMIFLIIRFAGMQIGDSIVLYAIFGASITILFISVQGRLATLVDKLLYGYENTRALISQRLVSELLQIYEYEHFAHVLTQRLRRLFDAAVTELHTQRHDGTWSHTIVGSAHLVLDCNELEALMSWMVRRPVQRAKDLARAASQLAIDRRRLPEDGIFVCFANDRTSASRSLLWLGPRPLNDGYLRQDEELLCTVAAAGKLALNNIDLQSALVRRGQELQMLYAELVSADERIRGELAQELHDNVMQDIYGEVYALKAQMRLRPDTAPEINHVCARLEAVIEDLRALCNGLRPPILEEMGIAAALRDLVSEIRESNPDILVISEIMEVVPRPSKNVESFLLAAAKIACTNTLRHSKARKLSLKFENSETNLVLVIEDDGQGFIPTESLDSLVRKGHFGLANLYQRASFIGASVAVNSAPHIGTTVSVVVPKSHPAYASVVTDNYGSTTTVGTSATSAG
ncbi:MAG: ATP-binding protein [Thermoflexales bacterium]